MKLIKPVEGKIILTKEERTVLKNACNVLKEIEKNLEELQEVEELISSCEDSNTEEAIYQINDSVDFITCILNGWHYCSVVEESEE